MDTGVFKKYFVTTRIPVGGAARRTRIILNRPERPHRQAWRIHREEKNRNAVVSRGFWVCACHQIHMRGGMRCRGVHLLTVDDEMIAITHSPTSKGGQVGTRMWLSKA